MFDLAYKNLTILAGARGASTRTINQIPRDLPDHFVGILEDMRKELAHKSVPLVVSTFLVKYRRNQERARQIANADVAFYYMPWMSIDGMLDAMDVYNDAILHYARSHDLPVVDDREAIPPDAVHYADCMHLTDGGAEAMADRFLRYLRTTGVLDRVIDKSSRGAESATSRTYSEKASDDL
jgi:hypothetical protein